MRVLSSVTVGKTYWQYFVDIQERWGNPKKVCPVCKNKPIEGGVFECAYCKKHHISGVIEYDIVKEEKFTAEEVFVNYLKIHIGGKNDFDTNKHWERIYVSYNNEMLHRKYDRLYVGIGRIHNASTDDLSTCYPNSIETVKKPRRRFVANTKYEIGDDVYYITTDCVYDNVKCEKCNGNGYKMILGYRNECRYCEGKGKIERKSFEDRIDKGKITSVNVEVGNEVKISYTMLHTSKHGIRCFEGALEQYCAKTKAPLRKIIKQEEIENGNR